jgi:flagellar motor switch protein FliN
MGTSESENAPEAGPSAADLAAAEAMMAGAAAPQVTDVPEAAPARDVNIDVILDVPVTLSLEVGRTRLPIRSLLQLNQGSVVELERASGEPLELFVNGTLVAHGEVVVVNDKFGIRLLDVVSPAERIRKLK